MRVVTEGDGPQVGEERMEQRWMGDKEDKDFFFWREKTILER